MCASGFKGAHCELEATNEIRTCNLNCQNGGLCRLGEEKDAKQVQNYYDIDDNDYMHCECPTGFAGNLCEEATSACSSIECLNGGECFEVDDPITGTTKGECNCEPAYDYDKEIFYAGEFCQYQSNEFCGTFGKPHFCTNGGNCITENPSAPCNCPDDTKGVSCQFKDEVDCTLQCINGSCAIGEPPEYSSSYQIWLDAEEHHGFQYCECDPGFSGKACEIEASNACGDFACLNGGTCEVNEAADGSKSYTCNCLTASDDANGIYYDGKYCQFGSTSICFDDVDQNEIYFCTNNGQCQQDYMQGCLCPEGFGGFSCEFVEGKDCTLDCKNGGECMLGSPPGESYLNAYWFNPDDYANWQYCSCPDGFSGELCESSESENCGSFSCLNGGSCKDRNGQPMENRCNCLNAYDLTNGGTYYDGLYCQFPSTSICYEGDGESYFCMNDGSCQDDYLQGCICPPGYGGFSCELVEGVDCTLNCGENGTCRLGAPPGGSHAHAYWYDPDAQADYQYCECKNGAGGKYCDQVGEDCGDFTCLNGGKCVDEHGNPMEYRCNCLDAWKEGVGGQPNVYYDGRFCQYESSSICFEGEIEGDDQSLFCMNGGTCRNDPLDGCDCPSGYSGFSCEFISGTDCTLDCGEDGECRLGSPPGDSHAHAYWFDPDAQDDFEYCECKNGAGGKYCKEKGEDCGSFTCLNGGKCEDQNGNPMVGRCNCLDAYDEATGTYYDGRFCQYPSTSVCLEDDSAGEYYFCMNDGICSSNPSEVGCDCPDGFAGFSCEFKKGTDCNLDCGENGTCRLGAPPGGSHAHAYWYDPDAQENYQYCECKNGYGGKFCKESGDVCEDFTCLNGGKCDASTPDRCNCLDAWEPGAGSLPNTYFDGRFCQYASTSVCFEGEIDGEQQSFFCMNGGECRRDHLQGCDCPDGFSGFSCEFIEGTDCTLDCQNGGKCRLGAAPDEDYQQAYWFNPDRQDDYQYCECPDGYGGKYCESKGTDCGDFTCFNGGKCNSEAGKPMETRCNCIEAFDQNTDTYFDGILCQYPSTSVCYENGDEAYFCMNGGRCQDDFTLGCQCNKGYGGFYCEFLDPQDCTKNCKNGGTCKLGSPPDISTDDAYWYNPEKSEDYQYCECPDGFSGEECEIGGDEKCGESECFNGGTCISRIISGTEVHHCDCRDAGGDGVYYAGKYCQYESTEVCKDDGETVFFCVNDGKCSNDYREGCQCMPGTRGFSCEFVLNPNASTSASGDAPTKPLVDEDAKCDLDCNGHGTCRNGIKATDVLGEAANANHLSYTHDNFQHCVCQDGWTGIYCDHQITNCQGDHFCLHGSECIVEDEETKCDCSEADSEIATAFAGDHCQHTADVCVVEDINGSPKSFCANGGTCNSYSDVSGTP